MIVTIYSFNSFLKYNVKSFIVCANKKYFTIMNKHIKNICNIEKIILLNNNIYLLNGILIQDKNITNIICERYELFK